MSVETTVTVDGYSVEEIRYAIAAFKRANGVSVKEYRAIRVAEASENAKQLFPGDLLIAQSSNDLPYSFSNFRYPASYYPTIR